ncbi:hypothetical protein PR048_014852 [Dryococelus australis]|uniref:Uncharacterized protein n=1 Tax=Dryococelus australis TaxID=614101 RepID=A0ABQ9HG48_9NEOP|nr:hypothetical protein PR048_014852 [Dryococelus australis]
MRVIEMSMEQRWNEGAWETGNSRENPPTNGIVRHDSHLRRSGSIPAVASILCGRAPHLQITDCAPVCRRGRGGGMGVWSISVVTHHVDTPHVIYRVTVERTFPTPLCCTTPTGSGVRWTVASAGVQERGKREIPEKTRRPAASSCTIPTCENPGAIPLGMDPGSPKWEASIVTATPPRHLGRTCFSRIFDGV